jgi:hypothetical protein
MLLFKSINPCIYTVEFWTLFLFFLPHMRPLTTFNRESRTKKSHVSAFSSSVVGFRRASKIFRHMSRFSFAGWSFTMTNMSIGCSRSCTDPLGLFVAHILGGASAAAAQYAVRFSPFAGKKRRAPRAERGLSFISCFCVFGDCRWMTSRALTG